MERKEITDNMFKEYNHIIIDKCISLLKEGQAKFDTTDDVEEIVCKTIDACIIAINQLREE